MTLNKTLLAAVAIVVGATALQPAIASAAGKNPEKRIMRMIRKADLNGDNRISPAEMNQQIARTFAFLDSNRDGSLTQDELGNQKKLVRAENKRIRAADADAARMMKLPKRVNKHFDKLDANGDGALSVRELEAVANKMFARRDRNKDGYLSREDFAA